MASELIKKQAKKQAKKEGKEFVDLPRAKASTE